jgi:hypothetical protein
VARVTTVNAARKDQGTCSKCGDPIPKGAAYRHASPGFRSRKIVRCMKPECSFRTSDLTTSKMATVYAAQEGAEDDVNQAEDADGLKAAMEPLAEAAREVADEYREAAEAMGEAGYEMEEKADSLESYADEVEQFDPDASCDECGGSGHQDEADPADPDAEELPECLVCEGSGIDMEAAREEAIEVIGGLDV